jgi:hypothetical protein
MFATERAVFFFQAMALVCHCLQASRHLHPSGGGAAAGALVRAGIWGWVLLAASMQRRDVYLRHRTLVINAVRLLLCVVNTAPPEARRPAAFTFPDPRLAFMARALGPACLLPRALCVFGMQLGFRQQLLHVGLSAGLAVCSRATLEFLQGTAEQRSFAAAQQLHDGVESSLRLASWALSPTSIAPLAQDGCSAFSGLVVLLLLHLASNALLLYAYYLTDWRHRRRFLRSQHPGEASKQAVEAACDTVAAQVMLDAGLGVRKALFAHLAALTMLCSAAFALAQLVALEVLPKLLPAELYGSICPAAPVLLDGAAQAGLVL